MVFEKFQFVEAPEGYDEQFNAARAAAGLTESEAHAVMAEASDDPDRKIYAVGYRAAFDLEAVLNQMYSPSPRDDE